MRHVTFSPSSKTTYMAGMLGLAAVVADAAMLDTALGLDVRQDDARAASGAPRVGKGGRGHGWSLRESSERWRVVVVPH